MEIEPSLLHGNVLSKVQLDWHKENMFQSTAANVRIT